jgi:hypothetical protein
MFISINMQLKAIVCAIVFIMLSLELSVVKKKNKKILGLTLTEPENMYITKGLWGKQKGMLPGRTRKTANFTNQP